MLNFDSFLTFQSCERVSDCCLAPCEQCTIYIYIISRISSISMRWSQCSLYTRPTRLSGSFSASSLKEQYISIHGWTCSSIRTHYSDSNSVICFFIWSTNQSLLSLRSVYCVLSGEATNTNFMVFDLTRLRLEPTIYHSVAILERYLDSIVTSNQQQNIYIINSINNLYDVQGAVVAVIVW